MAEQPALPDTDETTCSGTPDRPHRPCYMPKGLDGERYCPRCAVKRAVEGPEKKGEAIMSDDDALLLNSARQMGKRLFRSHVDLWRHHEWAEVLYSMKDYGLPDEATRIALRAAVRHGRALLGEGE